MRGGLDDALDKLARRDELRRRAAGEATGTPPAVTELVEAIAAVVSHHPHLGVTVGVEGAGDPVLLHFAFTDGQVQVSADKTVAARAAEAAHRHADFEVVEVVEEPAEESYPPPRASHDDQDRFGPTDFEYADSPTAERPYVDPPAERPYVDPPAERPYVDPPAPQPHPFAAAPPPPVPPQTYQPPAPPQRHPFAAAPPPVPPVSPQATAPPQPAQPYASGPEATTRRIIVPQQQAAEPQFLPPPPLAEPIPLQVERPEQTEMAARRLAALLRNDPTLLDGPQP